MRGAVRQAMRILAGQFVLAETIEDAVKRGSERRPYRFSFDMLGEAARTAEDAARYLDARTRTPSMRSARPTRVSIKLSALHPRFEEAKRARVFAELLPARACAGALAAARGVGVTLDAEESERLELTLDLFDALQQGISASAWRCRPTRSARSRCANGWRRCGRRISVRLVKGAYWDGEIKRAQQLGMPDYPVFTRKAATDVSYVACATRAARGADAIYPGLRHAQLPHRRDDPRARGRATSSSSRSCFGMGDALYDALLAEHPRSPCRIYAPVGGFTDLLPYLVRRLLENGANTSFVHQIADPDVPLEALVADPLAALPEPYAPDPRIPLPRDLYPDRLNSLGLDLSDQRRPRRV